MYRGISRIELHRGTEDAAAANPFRLAGSSVSIRIFFESFNCYLYVNRSS